MTQKEKNQKGFWEETNRKAETWWDW